MKENNLLPYRRTPDKQRLNLGPLINNTMYNRDDTTTEKKNKKTRTYNYTINYLVMPGEQEMQTYNTLVVLLKAKCLLDQTEP